MAHCIFVSVVWALSWLAAADPGAGAAASSHQGEVPIPTLDESGSRVEPAAAQSPVEELPRQPAPAEKGAVPRSEHGGLSEAERIIRLRNAIEANQRDLESLQNELDEPSKDYQKAEAEFRQLDADLEQKTKELAKLQSSTPPEELLKLEAQLDDQRKKWRLGRDRFELEIRERKALVEKIAPLEQKLADDRSALDALVGTRPPSIAAESVPAAPLPATPAADPAPAAETPGPTGSVAPVPGFPPSPPGLLPNLAGQSASTTAQPVAPDPPADPPNQKLAAATAEAERKESAAQEAEQAARSLTARTQALLKDIELERTLRDTAHQKVDNADETLKSLDEDIKRGRSEGENPANLQELRAEYKAAHERFSNLRKESRSRANHLDELQSELAALQADEIAALREAGRRRVEAEAARKKLDELRNPLAPANVLAWLLSHGLKIAVIILAVGGFVWLSRVFENRLVELMARRGVRGSLEERENRAKTLVGVFHNAASVVTIGGGILMVMDEIGMPVGPLMGGAAVLGLAVAFGAQSLIKDYFNGFMILLEQQYLVNDVIRIGDVAGQVERISMRMTALRDIEGRVHFIAHGQIASVTNLTHGWSRAVFDIGVSYNEDVNRVMQVLLDLGMQLRRDPEFRSLILEDPTMLGVDAFGESAVTIKFYIKTRPLKQWLVKRELLRRIKTTFDELGIEIPFPHRTVYHRHLAANDHADPIGQAARLEGDKAA
ncbi:MAG: mechanosensitive ion channel domain-containing protein [Pirellulales bacterium]